MNRSKIAVLLVVALAASLAFIQAHSALADQGVADGYNIATPDAVELQIEPSFVFDRADHVANGVALRNRVQGTIHLRGIPIGSNIVRALLYWNYSDDKAVGRARGEVVVNGLQYYGNKVADNFDPCWGYAGNHTYLATVTNAVLSRRHNQDFEVTIVERRGVNTNGEDPWNMTSPLPQVSLEGATMIVVYQTDFTAGTVYIYDALSGSEFSDNGTFTLLHASESDGAFFTMTGADGQKNSPNETTTFNGVQIAGPGGAFSASDWDGSTGWPLSQLWDVQTHSVLLSGTSSTVVYNAFSDCLVPVAFVIDKY